MMQAIKALLNEGVEKGDFPGAQYCLIEQGKIQCDHVGYKRIIPTHLENQGNEIYDIASLTKVVVTTSLVLKLIEKNLLTIHSRVSRYLPRFKYADITVYHLLTHTSGLPADLKNAKTFKTKHEVFNAIYKIDKIKPIETHVIYSDINYLLLGELVEIVGRDTLDNLAKKEIFEPLNMTNTSFRPNRFLTAPTEYRNDTVYKGLLHGHVHDEKSFACKGISGHAGCFSTAYDIALYIREHIKPKTHIAETIVNYLITEQVAKPDLDGNIIRRSIGYIKPEKGSFAGNDFSDKETIIHTGFTGCHMVIDRKQKRGFVLLSNAVHPKRENNKIMAYRKAIGNILFDNKGRFDEK